MTSASRDTTTGLKFEERVVINSNGIDLTKNNLYRYLSMRGKDYRKVISKKRLPDEAYFNKENGEFNVYEKKFQQTDGSADEKLETCAFKIWQYKKLGELIGAKKVTYTYILCDWFRQKKYEDVLEYVRSVPGCDYIFASDIVKNEPKKVTKFCFGY